MTELNGPDRPVRPFEPLVVLRLVVFLLFAAICVLSNPWSAVAQIVPVLVVVSLTQPLLAVVLRRRSSLLMAHIIVDVAVAVAVTAFDNNFMLPALLGLMALGVANVSASRTRRALPVAAVTAAGIGLLCIVTDVDHAERVALTAAIFLGYYGHLGYRSRDLLRRSRRDLHSAIHAAGGLTHTSDMETLEFELGGDVMPILGYSNEEWKLRPRAGMVHPDDLMAMYVDRSNVVEGQILDRTGRFAHKDGSWVWIRDVSRVVMHQGRPHLHGMLIDITAERAGLEKMTGEATTDQLTGLANRRSLLLDLENLEHSNDHVLVLMDLNRFKEINDTMGHDAGDQLLREVASRMQASVRPGDRLCRLGGDEFAVIMTGITDFTTVYDAVDRLAFEVSRPLDLNGMRLTTSLSAGIAESSSSNAQALTMLRHADLAMYSAKRTGQLAVVFDVALEQELARRMELTESLPAALADGSLALQYQPIVDCETGDVVGAEGLARWDHPTFGTLAPGSFLDVVLLSERSGEFTRAMVTNALETSRRLADAGLAIPIAVNIPVPMFEGGSFESWFVEERIRLNAQDAQLDFEIAEGDLHRSDQMERAIAGFTDLGVSISIDDFGTGNATFERLRWSGVTHLKIDRQMVTAASANSRDRSILKSVTDLALDLGYTIIAEGVETREQFDLIRDFGITRVQGWLFGRAVPYADFVELLSAGGFSNHPALPRPGALRNGERSSLLEP